MNTLPVRVADKNEPTKGVLYMWDVIEATAIGSCRAMVHNQKKNKFYEVDCLVVGDGYTPLLQHCVKYETAQNKRQEY